MKSMLVFFVTASMLALPCSNPCWGQDTKVKVCERSAVAPKAWVSEKPANRLRSYQFKIPAKGETQKSIEIAIYPESNPDVAKNFGRWSGTFVVPEGMTIDDMAKKTQREQGKDQVNMLDITGTWKFRERPNDPRSKEEILKDYRAIWVIYTTPEETTHIRFSGPKDAVETHFADFETFIKALK